MYFRTILTGALALSTLGTAHAQQNYFTDWPTGTSPQEVGKTISPTTSSPVRTSTPRPSTTPRSAPGTARCTFAELTHDTALRDALIKKFEPLMPGGAEAERRPVRRHVDDSIFGVAPLEIARPDQGPEIPQGRPVVGRPPVGEPAARRPLRRDPLLDRRHVHAHHAAARGLPRHRRQEVPRPRRQGDGRRTSTSCSSPTASSTMRPT